MIWVSLCDDDPIAKERAARSLGVVAVRKTVGSSIALGFCKWFDCRPRMGKVDSLLFFCTVSISLCQKTNAVDNASASQISVTFSMMTKESARDRKDRTKGKIQQFRQARRRRKLLKNVAASDRYQSMLRPKEE